MIKATTEAKIEPSINYMSNEHIPGCLGFIGDEILPNYVGINYIKPL